MTAHRRVTVTTMGCARNDTDSEELAARLEAAGWQVTAGEVAAGDVLIVNTCGFIDAAKRESVTAIIDAAGAGATVVAAGCLAERYGKELAAALPEAAAVLSFDDYPAIAERLADILDGRPPHPHTPTDRRRRLPITPVARRVTPAAYAPGHGDPGAVADPLRRRLDQSPVAPLKLASGCDRRCTFCAIPTFRGAFVSRPPDELVTEAEWLAARGVREIALVSENSTSYGKDLGDLRALEKLLPRLAGVVGRVRLHYLQPAEMRPSLIEAMAATAGVAGYFDLSFQHASGPVLRRMRRFGDRERFLDLADRVRAAVPDAGMRSNFIVGFPGETEDDYLEVERFIVEARLDAIGIFGYSDEDGTEAYGFGDKVPDEVVRERVDRLSAVAARVMADRAAARVGSQVEVIMASPGQGWAGHQAWETDGLVRVRTAGLDRGDRVEVTVTGTDGVDLVATAATVTSSGERR